MHRTILLDIAAVFENDLPEVAAQGTAWPDVYVLTDKDIAYDGSLRMNKGGFMSDGPDPIEFVKHGSIFGVFEFITRIRANSENIEQGTRNDE